MNTLFIVTLVAFITATVQETCPSKPMKAEIIKAPESVLEYNIGDRVSIVCAAHATPAPVVYWKRGKGKKAVPLPTRSNSISVLYFDAIQKEDYDTYQCVVETCCNGKDISTDVDIVIPNGEPDCNKKYGDENVVFGVDWKYATHDQAKANCEALGMELAVIKSAEENAQLLTDMKVSFNRHPNANKFDDDNWLWIGGTDKEEEGVWKNLYTNEELEYFNWEKPNQPDNWVGEPGSDEYNEGGQDYLAINRDSGLWDDSFNVLKRPYACRCLKRDGTGRGVSRRHSRK